MRLMSHNPGISLKMVFLRLIRPPSTPGNPGATDPKLRFRLNLTASVFGIELRSVLQNDLIYNLAAADTPPPPEMLTNPIKLFTYHYSAASMTPHKHTPFQNGAPFWQKYRAGKMGENTYFNER